MASCATFLFLVVLAVAHAQNGIPDFPFADDIKGPYCATRPGKKCCEDRNDDCTVPILDTVCYCDIFCNRTITDCCPDFWPVCFGVQPPTPTPTVPPKPIKATCRGAEDGRTYREGETTKEGCNTCTCRIDSRNRPWWDCEDAICLMRKETATDVNAGDFGWKASYYPGSQFSPRTLEEGNSYMLGTMKPERPVSNMIPINYEDYEKRLPRQFDARTKWPGLVGDVRDQAMCNSSWAFSTTATASDRLAIISKGIEKHHLSPQHLLSCNQRKQQGCNGGWVENAWWFLWKRGVVSSECYPYESGRKQTATKCQIPTSSLRSGNINCPANDLNANNRAFVTTPAYRISTKPSDIQFEIFVNGPVQAVFKVKEDFYTYKSGVYKYSGVTKHLPAEYRRTGYHSVRLIGWGEERNRRTGHMIPYWIAANSWGSEWGEDGFFKIVRGTNECEIESFVVGVIPKARPGDRWYREAQRKARQLRKKFKKFRFFKRKRF